jgi:N4-gp56 family major capsid protein
MSTTTFTSASSLAVKVWARKAFNDAVKATLYGKFTGKSDRSIVQVKTELKGEGDRVRFRLRALPEGIGVQEDETLEGQEEGLEYSYFDLNLGEKRHAIKVDLNLSAQRTMADVKADAKEALQEWLEEYLDTTFFEYLTGIGRGSSASVSKYHPNGALGGNSLLDPSSDRVAYAGSATSRATLTASDTMSLTILDKLAEKIKLASPTMRKASFDGKQAWVVVMHPRQVTSLRSSTSTGQWFDIQKAAMQGGKISDNPIWSESLGMYRDMILIESTRVPTFTDGGAGANVAGCRGLVLGAQAAVVAHGRDTDDQGKMKIVERTFDYGKRYGVGVTLIWGMAKTRFSGQSDFGCFAFETAGAAA